MKGRVLATESAVLTILGAANIVTGRLLGGALLVGLAAIAATCAWVRWPTQH